MASDDAFSFASSSELDLPVSVRINHLDGYQKPLPASFLLKHPEIRHLGSNQSPTSDLFVTAQVWADSKPLTVPVQTSYKSFKNSRAWNEWLTLPINYSSCPLSTQVALTIWDLSPFGGEGSINHAVPFGGTTVALFDKDYVLQKGRQRCRVHRHVAADGLSSTTTPAVTAPDRRLKKQKNADFVESHDEFIELERLQELMKKHEMQEIDHDSWLDPMVFRYIAHLERTMSKKMNDSLAISQPISHSDEQSTKRDDENGTGNELELISDHPAYSGFHFLYIDFPRFDHPVVFTDHDYPPPPMSTMQPLNSSNPNFGQRAPPEVTLGPGIDDVEPGVGRIIKVYDPEVGISQNPVENKHRRLVRNQRTGALDRDLKPNAKKRDELAAIIAYGPTQELRAEEKDLVWGFRHHLMRNKHALTKFIKSVQWSDASEARQAVQLLPKWTEIDVDDALELLGPSFVNPAVRTYAVNRLRKADDDELMLYLLQLVQALKFEDGNIESGEDGAQDSSLAKFLISRAVDNLHLGNFLHWYLMVECDDQSTGQAPKHRKLFAKVAYDFMVELVKTPEGQERRNVLRRQSEMITILSKIAKDVRFSKEDRIQKIERLKKSMADPQNELMSFKSPLPLPLDPAVSIVGCFPEESSVFKSSLFPLFINFKTATGERYPVIYKTGDDLRQDQLVIQIIMLMDRLLQKENLDLKLSPYRILATSTSAGAVQFIGSKPLAAIVSEHKGSLLAYLRLHNPDKSQPLGVRREAMENYVKSCAGYCVITYLLGVGDRHLDNLLVSPTGQFFHADFGYILGRDPKPFAPLMKLSKEMIEGMGGAQSTHYQSFKQYCFTAYTTLRKSSNLILNLFSLMVDANIPDIMWEPDKAVSKVKERFHPELRSDEEVIRMFESLMEDSVSAMFPALIDWTHGFVQRFRS